MGRMRDKLEIVAGIVLLVGVLVVCVAGAYEFGSMLVDIFGVFYAALVAGGTVIVCFVADRVVPRHDGGSWFGWLFAVMSSGDE